MKTHVENLSVRLGSAFIFPRPRTVAVSLLSRRETYILSPSRCA
jgi:hypothetical protein